MSKPSIEVPYSSTFASFGKSINILPTHTVFIFSVILVTSYVSRAAPMAHVPANAASTAANTLTHLLLKYRVIVILPERS
jgi:hypothetical protein